MSQTRRSRAVVLSAAAFVLAGALSSAPAASAAVSPGLPGARDIPPTTLPTNWGCFPGRVPNPCEGSHATTVLSSTSLQPRSVVRVDDLPLPSNPPIDCFYVYPTVTSATGPNAPRHIDADVEGVLREQAAPFTSQCRVFAPIYRQASIIDVTAGLLTNQTTTSRAQDIAFADVRGAWDDYLAHDNHGRGVMLIGHSQGSGMLIRLMTSEIDGDPAERAKLVGAILPGANVAVATGQRTGGNFQNIPTCAAVGEDGCVTAFSSFATLPPASSYFGRIGALSKSFGGPRGPGVEVACSNPAMLSGDGGVLHPILTGGAPAGSNGLLEAAFWNGRRPRAGTAFVVPGDHFTAACSSLNGANVLRVRPGAGTRAPNAAPWKDWGLHIGEMGLFMGNLVELVHQQASTYLASAPPAA